MTILINIKYYIRFMDDGALILPNKEEAKKLEIKLNFTKFVSIFNLCFSNLSLNKLNIYFT